MVLTEVVIRAAVVILTAHATESVAAVSILNCYASFLVERLAEMQTRVKNATVTAVVLRVSVPELHDSRMSSARFLVVRLTDALLQQLGLKHLVLVAEEVLRNTHSFRIEDATLT